MKPTNPKRVEVTGVTLNLSYPDGTQKVVTLDPKRAEAVFWSDRSVLEILAPFYDKIDREVSGEELATRFGDHILSICPEDKSEKFRITPDFVKRMWELENENGFLMPFSAKTIKCIPTCWDHF